MSRIGKAPIDLPSGVTITETNRVLTVKGPKGELAQEIHDSVNFDIQESVIKFEPKSDDKPSIALSGTMRALTANMVKGVSEGFERKLTLIGVGYRAQLQGSKIKLTLGFSHPIEHELPKGVTANCPSQTEIILTSADKQLLGQTAANIRAYRPPEPYKGKGVRYSDEYVQLKEAKKK